MTRDAEHTPSPQSVVGRLADRAWTPGDDLPEVGSRALVSGANADVESDQHRAFSWRTVVGYGDGDSFVCLQTEGCWPTIERTTNCWFAEIEKPRVRAAPAPSSLAGGEVREAVAELIDQIRQSEGAAVTIMCDNPDFNGQPNSAVEVVADWTNWQTVRFTGDTLVEALRNARDMTGGKIMGECGTLARVRLEQALTPRHEAPASPAWRDEYNRVEAIREAAEGQDRIARNAADPIARSDAETQAAGHWARYEREVAKLNAAPTRHEAPAEGAGEDDLLPCPFCGGDAEIVHIEDGENEGGSCACCTVCQASGNVEFGRKENFISNWNRRARSSAPEARS